MSNPGAVSRETFTAETQDEQVRAALCARYPSADDALAHYARLLGAAGVTRGLIGPRERPRLWSRHVANSAVLEELVAQRARVVDVDRVLACRACRWRWCVPTSRSCWSSRCCAAPRSCGRW